MRKFLCLMFLSAAVLLIGSSAHAQGKTVSGTVLSDDDGTPMIGVTVSNLSSNKKTQTNSAGYFSIEAENGQKIIFSFVGYVLQNYCC